MTRSEKGSEFRRYQSHELVKVEFPERTSDRRVDWEMHFRCDHRGEMTLVRDTDDVYYVEFGHDWMKIPGIPLLGGSAGKSSIYVLSENADGLVFYICKKGRSGPKVISEIDDADVVSRITKKIESGNGHKFFVFKSRDDHFLELWDDKTLLTLVRFMPLMIYENENSECDIGIVGTGGTLYLYFWVVSTRKRQLSVIVWNSEPFLEFNFTSGDLLEGEFHVKSGNGVLAFTSRDKRSIVLFRVYQAEVEVSYRGFTKGSVIAYGKYQDNLFGKRQDVKEVTRESAVPDKSNRTLSSYFG